MEATKISHTKHTCTIKVTVVRGLSFSIQNLSYESFITQKFPDLLVILGEITSIESFNPIILYSTKVLVSSRVY